MDKSVFNLYILSFIEDIHHEQQHFRSSLVQPIHFVDVAGKDLAAQRDKSKWTDENVEAAAVATMNSDPLHFPHTI